MQKKVKRWCGSGRPQLLLSLWLSDGKHYVAEMTEGKMSGEQGDGSEKLADLALITPFVK